MDSTPNVRSEILVTLSLENASLQFNLNPNNASWSLFSRRREGPYLEDVGVSAHYRQGTSRFRSLEEWGKPQIHTNEIPSSQHGLLRQISVHVHARGNDLRFSLAFAVPQEHPLLLWKLTVTNHGDQPVQLERLELMRAGFIPKRTLLPKPGILSTRYSELPSGHGVIRPHPNPGEIAFFSNGWGSWSHTGAYGPQDRFLHSRLGPFANPMWFNPATPRPRRRGHFASDMFGVLGDRTHRTAILAGFLSQKEHFGCLEAWTDSLYPALRLWANGDKARLDPGTKMTTDWAAIHFLQLDDPDPLGPYLEAVAREHFVQPSFYVDHQNGGSRRSGTTHPLTGDQPFTGWCSWYYFFEDLSAEDVRDNLREASKLDPKRGAIHHPNDAPPPQLSTPLEVIQIDDGFQTRVGDWYDFDPGFPDGVAPLAAQIRAADLTPGLWLAPFIVHPRSKLARKHPDWLLRTPLLGRPVNAGYLWNSFTTALDLTHPEALDYACQLIHTAVHDWNFPYLKLDFLYAAALPGRYHDPTRTRAQVLRAGLEALREEAGEETILLGCGCPLGSGIGLVDAMRIGADAAPDWSPRYKGNQFFFRSEPNMPAARNALQNILSRAPLHRRWWVNDPDCLLLRSDSNLTLAEVRSLATAIALSGGQLFISDHLPKLSSERLDIAKRLLPIMGFRPRVLDWFDSANPSLVRLDLENATGSWHLLGVFNWGDEAKDIDIPIERLQLNPETTYYQRSFWDAEIGEVSEGVLSLKDISPHGVRLLSLRPIHGESPQYLGGDLHISQGLEITHWKATPSKIEVQLSRPGAVQGQIDIHLPRPPQRAILDQREISWKATLSNGYRFHLAFHQTADLEVQY